MSPTPDQLMYLTLSLYSFAIALNIYIFLSYCRSLRVLYGRFPSATMIKGGIRCQSYLSRFLIPLLTEKILCILCQR